jgi:hypothetical protein
MNWDSGSSWHGEPAPSALTKFEQRITTARPDLRLHASCQLCCVQAQLVPEAQQLRASVLLHDPRGTQPSDATAEAAAAEVAQWSIDQWWQVPQLLSYTLSWLCRGHTRFVPVDPQ